MTKLFDQNISESSSDQEEENTGSAYDRLVGEGKKFKDNEALAKGKESADEMIERLKREQAQLRRDLDTRLSLEEFLAQTKQVQNSNHEEPGKQSQQEKNTEIEVKSQTVDITKLKQETIDSVRSELKREQNISQTRDMLVKAWGNRFSETLASKTEELGLSKEFVEELASTNPKALSSLLGLEQKPGVVTNSYTPPSSSVKRQNKDQERDSRYYDELARKDPRKFYSPQVQNQMFEDMKRLGLEAFHRS